MISQYRRASASRILSVCILRKLGKVPLLSADEEIELAQNMEDGAVAIEKINVLKGRLDGASEEEKAEIKEEIKTLQRDVDKGADAKKRLAEANLRLVVSIAKRYVGRGMLFLDLIQEGNLGLIKAVEKFDYKKGYKFSTYATWWIRQAITRAIADQAEQSVFLCIWLRRSISSSVCQGSSFRSLAESLHRRKLPRR